MQIFSIAICYLRNNICTEFNYNSILFFTRKDKVSGYCARSSLLYMRLYHSITCQYYHCRMWGTCNAYVSSVACVNWLPCSTLLGWDNRNKFRQLHWWHLTVFQDSLGMFHDYVAVTECYFLWFEVCWVLTLPGVLWPVITGDHDQLMITHALITHSSAAQSCSSPTLLSSDLLPVTRFNSDSRLW